MYGSSVLVVEDEGIVALNLRQQLEGLGYTVPALARTGEEAVQRVEELRPALVLMDIRLAGAMDGAEAAALIRSRFNVPVVFLTAQLDNADLLLRARVTEPYGIIIKPYEERELHIVIESALYKHQMEQRLEERERWFAAALTSIGDGVIAVDAAGRVTFLNPEAERLTGWPAEDAVGLSVNTVYPVAHETMGMPVRSSLTQAMAERVRLPLLTHAVLKGRDGTPRAIEDCAAPLTDRKGDLLGGVLVFRDITARKRLEERLRQAEKMDALWRLADGIAHEFNNLLTVIHGFSDLLLAALPEPNPAHDSALQIVEAAERATALSRQILALSRPRSSPASVLDLNALLTDMTRVLARVIGEDIDFRVELTPDLLPIEANPSQIQQVVLNLAATARDAMPAGGRLTVQTNKVERGAEPLATSPAASPGSFAVLLVRDSGAGLDEETRTRLFEPFFTSREPGRDNRLAMVYGLVKQCGGFIEVESAIGAGTLFRVYLPCVHALPALADNRPQLQPSASGGETILVVEDEEAVRNLIRLVLSSRGYTVLMAGCGADALRLAAEHPAAIDLLLTDVVMPALSGWDLAEQARSLRPGLRVLFISGYTGDQIVRPDRLTAADAFLHKPFSIEALVRKVQELLGTHPPAARPAA